MGKSVLITGGARSGKSHYAQGLAQACATNVLFVATATAGDEEMLQRIEEHRRSRPAGWKTLEVVLDAGTEIDLAAADFSVVVIDCITLLVNNVFSRYQGAAADKVLEREITNIIQSIEKNTAQFFIVTNEVGLGIVPENKLARLYRDALGRANSRLAAAADEVYLMVAGIPLKIK